MCSVLCQPRTNSDQAIVTGIINILLCSRSPSVTLIDLHCHPHSFAASENYFVFLEQPLRLNVAAFLKAKLLNRPLLADNLFVFDDEMVSIHLRQPPHFLLIQK